MRSEFFFLPLKHCVRERDHWVVWNSKVSSPPSRLQITLTIEGTCKEASWDTPIIKCNRIRRLDKVDHIRYPLQEVNNRIMVPCPNKRRTLLATYFTFHSRHEYFFGKQMPKGYPFSFFLFSRHVFGCDQTHPNMVSMLGYRCLSHRWYVHKHWWYLYKIDNQYAGECLHASFPYHGVRDTSLFRHFQVQNVLFKYIG